MRVSSLSWLNPQVQEFAEFLQLALNVNTGRYPSLAPFDTLKRSQARAQDGQSESEPLGMRDAVRILTVHVQRFGSAHRLFD